MKTDTTTGLAVVHATIRPAVADKINIHLPLNADPQRVFETLEACCEAYKVVEERRSNVTLVISRALLYIRQRRLYREYSKKFSDFLKTQVIDRYGISRSTVYEGIQIAKAFPELTPVQFANIGARDLVWLARLAKTKSMAHPERTRLIRDAQSMPIDELHEKYRAPSSRKELRVILTLRVAPRIAKAFRRALGDQDASSFLSSLLQPASETRQISA